MQHFSHTKYQPAICPRCNRLFTCTRSSDCWCMEYDMPRELIEYLQDNYDGCLCRTCIEQLVTECDNKTKNKYKFKTMKHD